MRSMPERTADEPTWIWLGDPEAGQVDPVESPMRSNGPFVFAHGGTACRVEWTDEHPTPENPARVRQYRLSYVTHAETGLAIEPDDLTKLLLEHAERIKAKLAPLTVRVAHYPSDTKMDKVIDAMAVRELLRVAAPIIDSVFDESQ